MVTGLVPLNIESLSGLAPSGWSKAHLINSSALPDKLFHPWHQPIIHYLSFSKKISCQVTSVKSE